MGQRAHTQSDHGHVGRGMVDNITRKQRVRTHSHDPSQSEMNPKNVRDVDRMVMKIRSVSSNVEVHHVGGMGMEMESDDTESSHTNTNESGNVLYHA